MPESRSEIEVDTDQEYQNEYSEDDDSVEPSPEREVFFKNSKSADRNRRRRHRRKVMRDQEKKHATERIDATHPKMRLWDKGATKNPRQKPRTPSTEILSDDDARAKPRSVSPKTSTEMTQLWKKKKPWGKHIKKEAATRGWESQESVEEEDVQDTKVPKTKKKNRRQQK